MLNVKYSALIEKLKETNVRQVLLCYTCSPHSDFPISNYFIPKVSIVQLFFLSLSHSLGSTPEKERRTYYFQNGTRHFISLISFNPHMNTLKFFLLFILFYCNPYPKVFFSIDLQREKGERGGGGGEERGKGRGKKGEEQQCERHMLTLQPLSNQPGLQIFRQW